MHSPASTASRSAPRGGRPVRLPSPRLTARDAAAEAIAGIVQRPGRALLTMLGTVLGVGAFVGVLGLTATGAGQISRQFTVLEDTTVTVEDNGPANNVAAPDTNPPIGFPADADQVAGRINGVTAAGVWWPVSLPQNTSFTGSLALSAAASQTISLLAASPGAVQAMGVTMVAGSRLTTYENDARQHVAMIDATTAGALGISAARLASRPAVFVGGVAYTVVGIYSAAQRVVTDESAMLIPENTALADFGNPQPGIGNQNEAQMVVATRIGAAQTVAHQIAAAELPADPSRLVVTSPPNPQNLQSEVTGDLAGLFLILALISLLIGAVGIANTTLVAVLERTGEIGLRRAVGARPRHIAVQFLAESTALGLFGGLVGACLGVLAIIAVTIYQHWTALLDPRIVAAAPVAGAIIGLLAGLYPALRASTIEPADALRR
jgi:putative ABC transport system permease protein